MYNYSFIIPYHNKLDYLYRLLKTIPIREDIEIIIVDDNSENDKHPVGLPDAYKIITIGSEDSKGAGRARNYGLRSATGKWLLFPDSDDIYSENFIQTLDKYVNDEIDILYFNVYLAYNYKTKQYKERSKYSYYLAQHFKHPESAYWIKSVKHSLQTPWNFMVRRDYVNQINASFAETPTCNDAFFHHYTAMNTERVKIIGEKLYYWILNPGSLTHMKKTHAQNRANREQGRLMITMRMDAGAWNTIPSFFESSGATLRNYGLLYTIRSYSMRLFNGIPWHKIWFHKIFDSRIK